MDLLSQSPSTSPKIRDLFNRLCIYYIVIGKKLSSLYFVYCTFIAISLLSGQIKHRQHLEILFTWKLMTVHNEDSEVTERI